MHTAIHMHHTGMCDICKPAYRALASMQLPDNTQSMEGPLDQLQQGQESMNVRRKLTRRLHMCFRNSIGHRSSLQPASSDQQFSLLARLCIGMEQTTYAIGPIGQMRQRVNPAPQHAKASPQVRSLLPACNDETKRPILKA